VARARTADPRCRSAAGLPEDSTYVVIRAAPPERTWSRPRRSAPSTHKLVCTGRKQSFHGHRPIDDPLLQSELNDLFQRSAIVRDTIWQRVTTGNLHNAAVSGVQRSRVLDLAVLQTPDVFTLRFGESMENIGRQVRVALEQFVPDHNQMVDRIMTPGTQRLKS